MCDGTKLYIVETTVKQYETAHLESHDVVVAFSGFGEYIYWGSVLYLTTQGTEPAGDRTSRRAERVTEYARSDKYYK